jgi:hypothetical protein
VDLFFSGRDFPPSAPASAPEGTCSTSNAADLMGRPVGAGLHGFEALEIILPEPKRR